MAVNRAKTASPEDILGRQAIAKYLGQPVTVARRWAKDSLPERMLGAVSRVLRVFGTVISADALVTLSDESGFISGERNANR